VSRRYVDTTPECWIPEHEDLRERDPKLKQGSKATPIENAGVVREWIEQHTTNSIEIYEQLLQQGVAPEIARTVLPQSMYTEFIETGSLAAYARLYALRTSPDAQREIQKYAKIIGEELEKRFPISWNALTSSSA
jgi:thymidylate synthase (FAD)